MVNPSSPDLDPARPAESADAAALARQARRLSAWARVVLVPVAVIGAVLSYQSLYKAAEPTFGPYLAAGFPLLVDLLILGASLQYVAGAKVGRPMTGWRLTAHCGVAGTLFLNALASRNLGEVPWHVTAPAVWAVLVELTGKQVLGQWKAANFGPSASIAPSLWLSAPIESVRTRLLMARTGVADSHQARIGVGMAAAAREALNLSLPRRVNARRDAKRVRRVVNRQLRAGSLAPSTVMDAVGWTSSDQHSERSPESILRAVVQSVLRPEPDAPHTAEPSQASGVPVHEAAPAHRVLVLPDSQNPSDTAVPATPVRTSAVTAPAVPLPDTARVAAPAGPARQQPDDQMTAQMTVPVASAVSSPVAGPVVPVAEPEPSQPTHPTQPTPTFTAARDRERIGLWAAAQARTSVPEPEGEPSSASGPDMSQWAEDSGEDTQEYGEYSADERYPGTAISGRPTLKQKEERLAVAARIVHSRPEITGTELRAELEREGWLVSDRTAARILIEARKTPPLRAVQA